jgi:hypothetical protein
MKDHRKQEKKSWKKTERNFRDMPTYIRKPIAELSRERISIKSPSGRYI